jgi:hypothetical protein
MTIYEYRPRQFGIDPTPSGSNPPQAQYEATMVGGETALDTSDGYTSWTRLQAFGGALVGAPTTYYGHTFMFEPMGPDAPLGSIIRVWWEMDYQHDAKIDDPFTSEEGNTVLMLAHFGTGYALVFAAGSFDAHYFGDVETQDLNPAFHVFVPAMLAGTFIMGAADPTLLATATVDVTRLTMFIETAGQIPQQWNQRTDALGREGAPTWRAPADPASNAQWRPRL